MSAMRPSEDTREHALWVNGRRVIEAEVVAGDELYLGGCRLRL